MCRKARRTQNSLPWTEKNYFVSLDSSSVFCQQTKRVCLSVFECVTDSKLLRKAGSGRRSTPELIRGLSDGPRRPEQRSSD